MDLEHYSCNYTANGSGKIERVCACLWHLCMLRRLYAEKLVRCGDVCQKTNRILHSQLDIIDILKIRCSFGFVPCLIRLVNGGSVFNFSSCFLVLVSCNPFHPFRSFQSDSITISCVWPCLACFPACHVHFQMPLFLFLF